MKTTIGFGIGILIGIAVLGCGGEMQTGTRNKASSKPADDGTCPDQRTVCGKGAFAFCRDLQTDHANCGACDRACSPGIACQAGVCQQTLCTGTTMPLTSQPITIASDPAKNTFNAYTVFADINGDGDLDLVAFQPGGPNTFRVLLGQPEGGFANPEFYPTYAPMLAISPSDMNHDGMDDLFVISATTPGDPPSQVEVWLGHPDGRLTKANTGSMGATTRTLGAADIVVADLSGDGWPDLIMPADTDTGRIRVFVSDSSGTLHLSNTYDPGGRILDVYVLDWNHDGSPDLVVRTQLNYALIILYNRGDGTFEPPLDCGIYLPVFTGDLLADFNHDGWMDLMLTSTTGKRVGVALGMGGCAFAPFRYYDAPADPALRAVDLNGDGQLDLIAIGRVGQGRDAPSDYRLSVLLGNPDGTFTLAPESISLGSSAITDVAIGEVTGDQRPDIIITSEYGQIKTWKNTCQ